MEWLVQMCMALCYLESKKCLHRDLKPHNVFLTGGRRIVRVRFLRAPRGAHVPCLAPMYNCAL